MGYSPLDKVRRYPEPCEEHGVEFERRVHPLVEAAMLERAERLERELAIERAARLAQEQRAAQ